MKRLCYGLSMVLAFTSFAFAADPPKVDPKPVDVVKLTPGKPASATVGKKCILTIETTAKKVTWRVPAEVDTVQLDGKRLAVWADAGVYTLVAQVPAGDDVLSTEVVLTVVGPRPPPTPPGPIPPGPIPPTPPAPDPKPQPVTSFRVFLVFESGDTITPAQHSILYGLAVENFLTATCTGGKAGWRRRDKDLDGVYDAKMAAVWNAVKAEFAAPKNTKTPAFAIQVNDKITIEPFLPTPAENVALLKKYSEGK